MNSNAADGKKDDLSLHHASLIISRRIHFRTHNPGAGVCSESIQTSLVWNSAAQHSSPSLIQCTQSQKDASGRVQRRQLRPSEIQSRREKQPEDVNASVAGDARQRPQGILMTPGTAAARRKQVKFGWTGVG